VSAKLEQAYKTSKLTNQMGDMTKLLMSSLNAGNLVKANETMSQFENLCDNLGVQAEIMDQVMDNLNSGTYAETDVATLINQVREENNMKVTQEFEAVGLGKNSLSTTQNQPNKIVNTQVNK
jgi:hypothetical protein